MEAFKITDDMKRKHDVEINNLVGKINNHIKWGVEHGKTKVCFDLFKNDTYYDEVRNIFEKAGYKIKPTGYIGGVWQVTEDICW